MKKFILAAVAATTIGLGMLGASAPANAQVFFGFGVGGGGYHHRGWGGDGYGYRLYPRYRPVYDNCRIVNVRRHHRWIQVRRCW